MSIDRLRRREFITLLGGAAATWPLAARAQQAMPMIGYLSGQSPEMWASRLQAFRQGLSEIGYVEGRNVAIEYRWAEGKNERLPALAADLARRQVNAIVTAGGTAVAKAAQEATSTIPIVFLVGADPVGVGLVTSLNRPGGNLSGVVDLTGELAAKELELLHELSPAATDIAVLNNPTNPVGNADYLKSIETGARSLALQLRILNASTEREIDVAFAALGQMRVGGLVIAADPFFNGRPEQLAALSLRYAMPAISPYREFAAAGGLMTYGANLREMHRQLGVYIGRILKGDRASELPVQQATKIELIVNLKTARTIGLAIPQTFLLRADEVIE
jgi:putative tryptophan/tyrosine transport system substrate-binding protein